MITHETQREAYYSVDKTVRTQEILNVLDRGQAMTAREIMKELKYLERNAVAPRLTELVEAGKVEVVGKKKCTVTGRMVAEYRRVA